MVFVYKIILFVHKKKIESFYSLLLVQSDITPKKCPVLPGEKTFF
jgi:hypothetical protein